ncbi:MAG: ribonuclease HII [Chloroflexi bacterium]|nr:ribonuclease HII [Chloroflexota bacterium]
MRAQRPTWQEEGVLQSHGYLRVAGVDEVGRGPLAGPVMAAAVVLPRGLKAPWLLRVRDSKVVSPREREYLDSRLREAALAFGIGMAGPEEIDRLGIVEATRRAMRGAVASLRPAADALLIDAVALPEAGLPFRAIVHGDVLCVSIAAASIIAKVARDRLMIELDARFPGYGLARHKGYPTAAHREALARLGPTPIHRHSFLPVRRLLPVSS